MEILNKCPICGSELEVHCLCQYSEVYRILKSGRISKQRIRKEDNGSLECSFICCTNDKCNFVTDTDWETSDVSIIHGEDDKLYVDRLSEEDYKWRLKTSDMTR